MFGIKKNGIIYQDYLIHIIKRSSHMFSLISQNMNEKGQGLVEYALILVLVAIVVIAALTLLGPAIGNMFSSINNSL